MGIQPTDHKEVWRQIPPEEKLSLLNKAHAKGIMAAITLVVIGSTLAIGLQVPWLLWGALLGTPIVFQFSANKAWRSFRPVLMLQYLAARAAARRYAYAANSTDLGLSLIFRGELQDTSSLTKELEEELEKAISDNDQTAVWVVLFNDALVMMNEAPGGAKCKFAHLLNEKMTISAPPGEEDDQQAKELYITIADQGEDEVDTLRLSSEFPAALLAFHQIVNQKTDEVKKQKKERAELLGGSPIT